MNTFNVIPKKPVFDEPVTIDIDSFPLQTLDPNIINNGWLSNGDFEQVRGQMVCVSHVVDDAKLSLDNTPINEFRERIKIVLLEKLLEELKKNKQIEFTSINDNLNHQTIFKARIFVTPDDKIRALRKAGK